MAALTAEQLAVVETAPELEGLRETAAEWWLGGFALDKVEANQGAWKIWPRWRRGWSYPLLPTMRLGCQPFHRADGTAAVAIWVDRADAAGKTSWIGWARGDRIVEAQRWVDHFNDVLRQLCRRLDQPLGAMLLAGKRFEVSLWQGEFHRMGVAVAHDRDGDRAWLTTCDDVACSYDDLRARLGRDAPGLAPVLYVGPADGLDGWGRDVALVAERLPSGTRLAAADAPSPPEQVRELGACLARTLAGVHAAGVTLATLQPEGIWIDDGGAVMFAVRGAQTWWMPRPNMTKAGVVTPWPPWYLAPELWRALPLRADPPPSADVFSLGVILAERLLGALPFPGDGYTAIVSAQLGGGHLPLPPPLGALLASMLAPVPAVRPGLEIVLSALS